MTTARALAASLLILALSGGTGPSHDRVVPVLAFALHYSQGSPDNATPDTNSGTVIAGWRDGLVVFARDPSRAGSEMFAGRLDVGQIDRVMQDLRAAGFFADLASRPPAPGSPYWVLTAVDNGKRVDRTVAWDTDRFGPPDSNADEEAEDRASARMWAASRVALSFAYPTPGSCKSIDEVPEAARRLRKSSGHYVDEQVVRPAR
jgi:hypothetical protein